MKLPFYLDQNVTTPADPLVADAITPHLHEHFGNPSSIHVYDRNAHQVVKLGREQVEILTTAWRDRLN